MKPARTDFQLGCRVVDAVALEVRPPLEVQFPVVGAARDHDRAGRDLAPVRQGHHKVVRHPQRRHLDRTLYLGPELLGLHQRFGGQLRAGEAGREAEVVLDTCARARLPAYGNPFQHQRVQSFRGAVDGSRQSGGPSTDDNNVVDLPWYRAVRKPQLVAPVRSGSHCGESPSG